MLDFNKAGYPFILRKWQAGDKFQPLGMKGTKKISDFLTSLKLSGAKRENALVLESHGEICWVVGHRISEKFKVTHDTKHVFHARVVG